MKKLFNQICEEFGVVGASAIVFKNNELTSLNYGKATDEKETSENTIYRIASISKISVQLVNSLSIATCLSIEILPFLIPLSLYKLSL